MIANALVHAIQGIFKGYGRIGNVGGDTIIVRQTVPTGAALYTANDNVGGIMTLTEVSTQNTRELILQDIDLWDTLKQDAILNVDFWETSPAGTYTDQATQVMTGDHAAHLGHVQVVAADYVDDPVISRVTLRNLGITMKPTTDSKNIFMTIMTPSTPTYAANGLHMKFGFHRD